MIREIILDTIFPKGIYCAVCGKYIDKSRKYCLCDHCIKRMNFQQTIIPTEHIDFAMASMGYGLYERRLMFNLKYDAKTYMARIIADIMYDSLYDMVAKGKKCPILQGELIVPVPISQERLKARGFNQSEKIAKHLGKKLGIPLCECALERARNTTAQRALSKKEREANMADAFFAGFKAMKNIKGKKVILLDDIYTTGATAKACANILKECGVEKIYYLSLLFAGNRHHLMVE